jgi:hypothetical protein
MDPRSDAPHFRLPYHPAIVDTDLAQALSGEPGGRDWPSGRWGRYLTAGVAVGYLLGRVVFWLALVGAFIACGLALAVLSAAFGNVFSARR